SEATYSSGVLALLLAMVAPRWWGDVGFGTPRVRPRRTRRQPRGSPIGPYPDRSHGARGTCRCVGAPFDRSAGAGRGGGVRAYRPRAPPRWRVPPGPRDDAAARDARPDIPR